MPKMTVGGTATVLAATAPATVRGTQVKAADGNSGKVYVGYSNAVTAGGTDATDGMELGAGQAFFVHREKAASAAAIWVIGSASGQVVYYDAQ